MDNTKPKIPNTFKRVKLALQSDSIQSQLPSFHTNKILCPFL